MWDPTRKYSRAFIKLCNTIAASHPLAKEDFLDCKKHPGKMTAMVYKQLRWAGYHFFWVGQQTYRCSQLLMIFITIVSWMWATFPSKASQAYLSGKNRDWRSALLWLQWKEGSGAGKPGNVKERVEATVGCGELNPISICINLLNIVCRETLRRLWNWGAIFHKRKRILRYSTKLLKRTS
jgi:hypothetical protein